MAYRNYATANSRIVDPSGNGDFTTIATALTASATGQTIFIRPGTYTENLTLVAGVNLCAFDCDAFNNVIISGNATFSGTGTVNISGIRLQTNSAALLTVSGNSASIVNLIDCYLNCTNNTGITFSSSNAAAFIYVHQCFGDLGTTGIKLFDQTSAGTLEFWFSKFTNTGASTTATTQSAGSCLPYYSSFEFPITNSSTAYFSANYCRHDTGAQNVTCLTIGGSGANTANYTEFNSGSASAISASTALGLRNCIVFSTNATAIAGVGTVTFDKIGFPSSGNAITTPGSATTRFGIQRSQAQPCFLARLASSITNATGDNTSVSPIIFDTSVFDQNSNYSTGTGNFTAPVTGRYLFSSSITLTGLGAAHTLGQINLVTTAISVFHGLRGNYAAFRDATSNAVTATFSCVCSMTAGDTAAMQVQVTNGTKVVNIFGSTDAITFFSGHLIC